MMSNEKKESLGLFRNTLFSTSEQSTASSKDRGKDFDATKQTQWLQLSKNIIDELGKKISSFPQIPPVVHQDIHCPPEMLLSRVGCTYAWLADKRREVAKMLKQGPFRHQFGLINKAGFVSTDQFNLTRDLPTQKNLIYKQLMDLIHHNQEHVELIGQQMENGTKYAIRIKLTPEECDLVHQKNAESLFPFIEDDVILTITFDDYGQEDSRTSLVVDHRPTPFNQNYRDRSSYFQVQYELIEPYFQACCDWDSSQEIQEFLINAGKLAYRLAQLQPVGRGNSAIVEWMIRGLAKEKNIELGPFNHDELGWDFKAFFTPDINVYAHWFSEKAFTRPELVENKSVTPKIF